MSIWSGVLDSCPGLLCCVINLKGKLLYASHGYKSVAARLFGHKCNEGSNYPPLITEIDQALHEILMAACLGDTNAIEIEERGKIWEVTAAPLRLDAKKIEGVVLKMSSENLNSSGKSLPPVIESNPDILNSVPFRACVVNSLGVVLAANKFLISAFNNTPLISRNIIEFAKFDSHSSLVKILSQRVGKIECRIPEIIINENFYDADINIYLDNTLNPEPKKIDQSSEFNNIKLHATPIKWNGEDNVMLTFEDVTEFRLCHDQLRRLLTFDNSTGILNRRGIEHIILKEFAKTIRNTEQLSLIIMNIDGLKNINETRGYETGNKILRNFVESTKKFLMAHTRHNFARWSGNKFMILAHCSGAAAVVLANEIGERANNFSISINAGVSDLNKGSYAGVDDFIGAAYDAMLEAKRSGKNITVLADKS